MQHLCRFNYKASRNRAMSGALSDCCYFGIYIEIILHVGILCK